MIILFFQKMTNVLVPSIIFLITVFIQVLLYSLLRKKVVNAFKIEKSKWKVSCCFIGIFLFINLPWLWILKWWINHGGGYPYILGPAIDTMPSYFAYMFTIWYWSSFGIISILIANWFFLLVRKIWRKILKLEGKAILNFKETGVDNDLMTPQLSRREFVQATSIALTVSPLLASTYGAYVAHTDYKVEKIELSLAGLPLGLNGTTIVQLTDIHAGVFMDYHRMMEFVNVANGLSPDLIVLTGDYVSYSSTSIPTFLKAFSHLQARYGVYATLGNHDLFTDSVEYLRQGLSKYNIRLLINEQEKIYIKGIELNLLGITYIPQSDHEKLAGLTFKNAIRGIEILDATILLSHQPNVFPDAARLKIPLTLAGHTHGGQVKIEFLGHDIAPSKLMTDFTSGLYKINDSQLYVSRGVGTSGPPVRLGSVPEITHITLVK